MSTTAEDDVVERTLASSLDSLDGATNYRDWIMELARPYLGAPTLEVGAGTGTFTSELADEVGAVDAMEPGSDSHAILAERVAGDSRVTVHKCLIEDLPNAPTYRSVILVNVLEHIENDESALEAIHDRLEDDGHIILWVPAFQLLFSNFDRQLGHFRRYRKFGLSKLVEKKGFTIVDSRYVNAPGWFSWLIMVRLFDKAPTGEATVKIFDRVIVPIVRLVENRVRFPFGQSIFLVAQKNPRS